MELPNLELNHVTTMNHSSLKLLFSVVTRLSSLTNCSGLLRILKSFMLGKCLLRHPDSDWMKMQFVFYFYQNRAMLINSTHNAE